MLGAQDTQLQATDRGLRAGRANEEQPQMKNAWQGMRVFSLEMTGIK